MDEKQMMPHTSSTSSSSTTLPGQDDVSGDGGNQAAFLILWGGLFIFLLLWAWVAVKSCYEMSQRGSATVTPTLTGPCKHDLTRKERKERLIHYFESEKRHMELTSEVFTEGDEAETPCNDKDGENCKIEGDDVDDDYDTESNEKFLRLKLHGEETERVFSKYCAICLDRYEIGDNIVWSSHCRHVFHRDCLIDGLTRFKNDKSPCPCCRTNFCDFPKDDIAQNTTISCES